MKYWVNKHFKTIIILSIVINIIFVLIYQPACPWKVNFNIDCAGCGATRMFKSLFEFDFYQAFRFNPLLFCFLLFFIIYGVYVIICKIKNIKYYKIKQRDLWIILILVIIFMILRNIPMFYYLKPTLVR